MVPSTTYAAPGAAPSFGEESNLIWPWEPNTMHSEEWSEAASKQTPGEVSPSRSVHSHPGEGQSPEGQVRCGRHQHCAAGPEGRSLASLLTEQPTEHVPFEPGKKLLQFLICKIMEEGVCEWRDPAEQMGSTSCPASQADSRRFWDSSHQQDFFFFFFFSGLASFLS